MTTERLRDWDLRELVERLDHAYDGLGLLLHDDMPDRLREIGEDVLGTLEATASFLAQLRHEHNAGGPA